MNNLRIVDINYPLRSLCLLMKVHSSNSVAWYERSKRTYRQILFYVEIILCIKMKITYVTSLHLFTFLATIFDCLPISKEIPSHSTKLVKSLINKYHVKEK